MMGETNTNLESHFKKTLASVKNIKERQTRIIIPDASQSHKPKKKKKTERTLWQYVLFNQNINYANRWFTHLKCSIYFNVKLISWDRFWITIYVVKYLHIQLTEVTMQFSSRKQANLSKVR